MKNYGADVVVKENHIAVHFYEHDGKNFRYIKSKKCLNVTEVFDFLFMSGISGTFLEAIVYLENSSRQEEVNEFIKRARRGLNWVVQNDTIQIGIKHEKYKLPSFIKVNY